MVKAIQNWKKFKKSGVSDDDALDAYLSYAAQQTYEPTLFFDQGSEITFRRKRPLPQGLSLLGPRVADQRRSGNPVSHVIKMRTNGGVFYPSDNQTFSVTLEKLTLDGTKDSWLIDGHSSKVVWTTTARDITCVNAGGVLGSPDQKLLITVLNLDGYWNMNNVQHSGLHVGGSDNVFNFSNCLIDCPPSLHDPDEHLLKFSSLSKTYVSGLYITAERHPGLLVSGGNGLVISNSRFEGRNAGAPSHGAVVNISSGGMTFRDCWFAYGMTNPGSDKGLIHASGGNVHIDGAFTDQASGTNAPLFYASGGQHRVINAHRDGGAKPVVVQAGSSEIDVDNSVELVVQ